MLVTAFEIGKSAVLRIASPEPMELNAAISAMLLDVNPFDQPGVENYKREIRQLVAESRSTSFSTMG